MSEYHRKILVAKAFVDALTDAGLVPDACTKVIINATVGEPLFMDYSVLGDERLLDITDAISEAASSDEGGVVH